MIKINLDRVRICLTCPDSFFDKLFSNFCVLKKDSIEFDGFTLSNNDSEENNRNSITARLFLEEGKLLPTKLGDCEFRRSRMNGIKCFFTYNTSLLYETDTYTYSIRNKNVQKYNYFIYPLLAFEVMGLKFNNVTSVELAADTDSNVIHKINYAVGKTELFDMILHHKKILNPNEELNGYGVYYPRSRKRISSRPTLYVKSPHHKEFGNNISLKIYDKAREMAQSCPYKETTIREWNNMTKNIQRMEVTIENKPFQRFFKQMRAKDPGKYANVGLSMENGSIGEKEALEYFFMELGQNQDLRREMFTYFSNLLLHFRLKNHTKDQITLLCLAESSISSFGKKRKQKAKEYNNEVKK